MKTPNDTKPFPRSLKTLAGETLLNAGPAPERGARRYLCAATGSRTTVMWALVRSTGPTDSIASVVGNPALDRVVVSHAAFCGGVGPSLGSTILIGAVHFSPARVRAGVAWIVKGSKHPGGRFCDPIFSQGSIISTGLHGVVIADEKGRTYFGHTTSFRLISRSHVGMPVTFRIGAHAGRPAAFDVKPAIRR